MSHLHFPDGLLPLWLFITGFALTALIMSHHINFTVLVNLLLGPWICFIGVFVVNYFLGFIVHGVEQ